MASAPAYATAPPESAKSEAQRDGPSLDLDVKGMHCLSCVRRVRKALEKIPGVVVDDVSIGNARGSFDPEVTNAALLIAAVQTVGYTAAEVMGDFA
mgnify:CR=1 FL=1